MLYNITELGSRNHHKYGLLRISGDITLYNVTIILHNITCNIT